MKFSPRAALAALVVVIAAAIIVHLATRGGHEPAAPVTKTVTLGGPGNTKLPLTPPAQAILHAQARKDAADLPSSESDLHESTRPSPDAVRQADALTPPGQPPIPARVPLASVTQPGCKTALVRNFSSRRGAPVLLGVIHWTGSRPIAGSWADVNAIVRWFDTPAAQASSNYVTDSDGHCALTVAESQKAWTQAGANPWSVSVEIVNQGVQPLFTSPRGRAIVVRLMRAWHAHWKIPYRHGAVSQAGCRVTRTGFLAHRDLGACGGGHPDVGTFDLDGLIRDAANGGGAVTATDRATCRKIQWWRAHGRPHGKAEQNAVRRRKALAARGVTCTARGPVKR